MITGSRADVIVDDLLRQGYSRIPLDQAEAARLGAVFAEGRKFFGQDLDALLRFSGSSTNHGYRKLGDEYSVTPDRPDQNDSFSLWADDTSLIPNRDEIGGFLDALSAWRAVLTPMADGMFSELAARFGVTSSAPITFERSSYQQLNNYYPTSASIELLQDRHEDGHLVTFINATAPGLEMENDGRFVPVDFTPDEVMVMPGSLLTAMTGGQVSPLYHRVRNCQEPERMSLMYFVNPQLDHALEPWLSNETNVGVDILDLARTLPNGFGLPDIETL
jgi:isopenicillin N synthase-like dioxygenase